MQKFDFYEFTGVISPGIVALLIVAVIWPEHVSCIQKLDLSLGGFGLAISLAYVAGHLIQSSGNVLESAWWYICRGQPFDWP